MVPALTRRDRRRYPIVRRPAIHLTPPTGWMNDPNGLVLHDGVWHACYQHNPGEPRHGNLHWRRATSTDLLRWTDRGVMLAPDHLGQIYSGSMVVDHDDTAGFGAGAFVAVYTHHLRDGVQRQSLAASTDGDTWLPYARNPVLESDAPDFRDPKVLRWAGPTGSWWLMALAVGDHVELYRSSDLRAWSLAGDYRAELPGSGVWECPDLVALGSSWLLVFGVAEGGPGGHSGTFGVLGGFDGERFEPTGEPFLLDHGPDCYAMQTFWGTPEPGRPTVGLAWMNSWRYALAFPAPDGWNGRMTLPRTFELDRDGRLVSLPAASLAGAPVAPGRDGRVELPPGQALVVDADGAFDVELGSTRLAVSEDTVTLERDGAGIDRFAGTFDAAIAGAGPTVVVVDHGSVEVFADGGATTLTALLPPDAAPTCRVTGAATVRAVIGV
jgi:fructan beta-fructosidase